jgi:hypothetical protein
MRKEDSVIALTELEHELISSRASVIELDDKQYDLLRQQHLLQAKEVPLELSPPRVHAREHAAAAGAKVVSPSKIMHDVRHERLVRSGNLQVGSIPTDFRVSEGEPHYLEQVPAGLERTKSNAARFSKTTGGFGPRFHKTGELGIVDIPTASGISGVDVSKVDTIAVPQLKRPPARTGFYANTANNAETRHLKALSASSSSSMHTGKNVKFDVDAELAKSIADDEIEDISNLPPRSRTFKGMSAADSIEGISGTRGEGMEGSLKRQAGLNFVRTFAGAGKAGALSLNDIAENNAITDRMLRPQGFLRNPRHIPHPEASGTGAALGGKEAQLTASIEMRRTLLVAGANTGMSRRSTLNLPPPALATIPPGTALLPPANQTQVDLFQTVSAEEIQDEERMRSAGMFGARTLTGASAGIEKDKPRTALLASRGVPQDSTVLHGAGKYSKLPPESIAGYFLVRPAEILFNKYEGGQKLSTTLILQNVDSLSRHLRILPPHTGIFHLQMPRHYPGDIGAAISGTQNADEASTLTAGSVIAPGMSVKVNIIFTPPASASFSDELTIVTEAGTYVVPLIATVPGPELSLPQMIDAGILLRHDLKRINLRVTNVGAAGKFRFLPVEVFRTPSVVSDRAIFSDEIIPGSLPTLPSDVRIESTHGGRIHFGPFILSPSSLNLATNEEAELHLIYSSDQIGFLRRSFVVLASDGSVFTYFVEATCSEMQVGIVNVSGFSIPNPSLMGVKKLNVFDRADAAKDYMTKKLKQKFDPPLPANQSSKLLTDVSKVLPTLIDKKLHPTHSSIDSNSLEHKDPERKDDQGVDGISLSVIEDIVISEPPSILIHNDPTKSPLTALLEFAPKASDGGEHSGTPIHICFGPVSPGIRATREVTIRNDSLLPLDFRWILQIWERTAPQLTLPNWDEEDVMEDVRKSRALIGPGQSLLAEPSGEFPGAIDPLNPPSIPPSPYPPPFTIEPSIGALQALSETKFTFTYSPSALAASRGLLGAGSDALAFLEVLDVPHRSLQPKLSSKPIRREKTSENVLAGDWIAIPTPRSQTPLVNVSNVQASLVTSNTMSSHIQDSTNEGSKGKEGGFVDKSPLDDEEDDVSPPPSPENISSNEHESDYDLINVLTKEGMETVKRTSVVVARVSLQGAVNPTSSIVTAFPSVVILPGPLFPGQVAAQTITLTNNGDIFVDFKFIKEKILAVPVGSDMTVLSSIDPNAIFAVHPPLGSIPPHGTVTLSLTLSVNVPGRYECDLECEYFLQPLSESKESSLAIEAALAAGEEDILIQRFIMKAGCVRIRASGSAKCPEVRFAEPIVDLGQLGCERTEKLTKGVRIINTSDAYSRWHISRVRGPGSPAIGTLQNGTSAPRIDANQSTFSLLESETDGSDAGFDLEMQPPDMRGVFSNIWFSPSTGVLPPFGHIDVLVSVDTGSHPERLRAFLRVVVEPFDDDESGEESLLIAAKKTAEARQVAYEKLTKIEAEGGLPEGKESELAVPDVIKPRKWRGVPQELRSPPAYMRLVGEVQAPRLCLSTHKLMLGVVFLGVPVRTSFKVKNLCNLSVDFKLDGYVGCKPPLSDKKNVSTSSDLISSEAKSKAALGLLMGSGGFNKKKVQGPPVSKFEISFEHSPAKDGSGEGVGSGRLGPKQEIEVFVTFNPRCEGLIKDHLIACDVIGMQHPLGITVEALARGLTLAYSIVDDATGFVIPLSPHSHDATISTALATDKVSSKKTTTLLPLKSSSSLDTSEVLDMDAAFKKSMDDIDASLQDDPAVLQIKDAIARAERYGASIGRIPDLLFSTPHFNLHSPTIEHILEAIPLGLLQRRSFTLHVLNLSGIPTHLRANAQKLTAFEVLQNGEDTNWPALYSAAEAIEVATLSDPTGFRKVKEMHASVMGHIPFTTHSHSKHGELTSLHSVGGSGMHAVRATVTSSIAFNDKMHNDSSLFRKSEGSKSEIHESKHEKMESVVVKRIGGVHKFGLQPESPGTSSRRRHSSDNNDSQFPPDGNSFSSTLDNTIASITAGRLSTTFSGTSKGPSTSPPRRPKSFLSNDVELGATFQSRGGRLHLAMNECKKLMRQSLGVQAVLDAAAAAAAPAMTSRSQRTYFGDIELKGASFEIYPKQCNLPPFGHLAISIAGLADLPGTYDDTFDLTVFVPAGASSSSVSSSVIPDTKGIISSPQPPLGFVVEPKLACSVKLKAIATGNTLSLNNKTVGLQLDGASGTTGPTINFGDQAVNSPELEKSVLIENNGPLDAHLVFHTVRDRRTISHSTELSAPTLAVDVLSGPESEDSSKENDIGSVGIVVRPLNDRVDIALDNVESSMNKPSPIPFKISPTNVFVPAYGHANVKVTGRAIQVSKADLQLAKELGWPEELQSFSRAKFSADAVFVQRGTLPPSSLLVRASAPYTPIDPSFGVVEAFDENNTLANFPSKNASQSTPGHLQPQFLRDALTVHAVMRPFVPLLTIEGAVALGDSRPWVSLHVSSLAVESALQVASSASKVQGVTQKPPASCTKTFSLTNASGSDLTFVLKVDGPFQIINASTSAPPHPVTRVDVLAAKIPPSKSGNGSVSVVATESSVNDSLVALFAPGLMKKAISDNDGVVPKIYSLPPKCNMTIHVAFDPVASKKIAPALSGLTSSQLFLNKIVKDSDEEMEKHTDTASNISNAFTSTVIVSDSTHNDIINPVTGKPFSKKVRATTAIANGQDGTLTLSSTGTVSSNDSFSTPAATSTITKMGQTLAPAQTDGVDAVIAASITRLRGEYLGLLSATFANGTVQEVGLRCEVLRPAIVATPSSHSFGTVRILPSGAQPGEGVSEEKHSLVSLKVSNPTTVDAHWSLKHVPAPPTRLSRPGEVVDWQSLGLPPENALWAAKQPSELSSAIDDPSAFAFSSVNGILMGPTAPLEIVEGKELRASVGLPQPITLMVVFRPKEAKLYQSRFRICVKEGESFEVLLRGRGSLEEKEKAIRV